MSEITAIKGNIGKEIKFLPAKDGKAATVYTTLAENKWKKIGEDENGKAQFEELPPEWHDIAVTGNAAVRFKEKFQPGDAIVVFGTTDKKEYTTAEGEVRSGTTLYVKGFGPDAERTKFTIQRDEPAADAEADLSQQMMQQQAQAVDAGPAMQPAG